MLNGMFDNYDKKNPHLLADLLQYFDLNNRSIKADNKSIGNFCNSHKISDTEFYDPWIISRICKRLCDANILICTSNCSSMGMQENYLTNIPMNKFDEQVENYVNSVIYGFNYIYNLYKNNVIPLVWEKEHGDYSAGTGFKFLDGIVTAKHCITDVKNLQIKGYKASELKNAPIYISENESVDIAFIKTRRIEKPLISYANGEIMQEVLVMGYPKIPAFTQFLTAEIATISSKANARMTPTMGFIASYGYEYLAKIDAMLITAKIRGGNSGGPVINQNGQLVGIACQLPNYNGEIGDYDDLGYGIAVPSKYLHEIVTAPAKQLQVKNDFFRDYME